MEKGERIEFRIDEGDPAIPLRVISEEADGWIRVTTELEYEAARLRGADPEPLLRIRADQAHPFRQAK
jgi:hypothetical protein